MATRLSKGPQMSTSEEAREILRGIAGGVKAPEPSEAKVAWRAERLDRAIETRVGEMRGILKAGVETIAELRQQNELITADLTRLMNYQADVMVKCRNTKGPCICGAHLSEAQALAQPKGDEDGK